VSSFFVAIEVALRVWAVVESTIEADAAAGIAVAREAHAEHVRRHPDAGGPDLEGGPTS
jgi:hypothetical protein